MFRFHENVTGPTVVGRSSSANGPCAGSEPKQGSRNDCIRHRINLTTVFVETRAFRATAGKNKPHTKKKQATSWAIFTV